MYDRNVEFPQRYRLQKVDGTDDIFDLIPAPGEIRNEGTLINKSALLKDATAALFGLDENAVPDDAFYKLSGLYNHCWKKTKSTYTCGYSEKNAEDTRWETYPIDVYDGTYDETGKTLSLTKIGRITCQADYPENIVGKFIAPKSNSVWPYYVCLVTGKNSVTDVDANFLCIRFDTIVVSETSREEYYVTAQDKNAYTDGGFLDGYEYEYLGVPFENATQKQVKIATGSYTGTGTYGSSNPNSLTFDFEPRFVIISNPFDPDVSENSDVAILHSFAPVPNNATAQGVGFSMVGANVALKRLFRDGPETTITNSKVARWCSTDSAAAQLNQSGWVYQYMAIG